MDILFLVLGVSGTALVIAFFAMRALNKFADQNDR